MITIVKIIKEAIAQAFQQLAGSKLRSFLSLLGITIGSSYTTKARIPGLKFSFPDPLQIFFLKYHCKLLTLV